MKAPNKIYLTNGDRDHLINYDSEVANGLIMWCEDKITDHDIEYIRKDKLIKWAKQKQYESTTIVADNFWQEVIDKINEI